VALLTFGTTVSVMRLNGPAAFQRAPENSGPDSISIDAPKDLVALPLLTKNPLVKPPHNVQYVDFVVFEDEVFITATLCFQNVPDSGRLLGKFERPYSRVLYYDHLDRGRDRRHVPNRVVERFQDLTHPKLAWKKNMLRSPRSLRRSGDGARTK
jgi:hypothetical protein